MLAGKLTHASCTMLVPHKQVALDRTRLQREADASLLSLFTGPGVAHRLRSFTSDSSATTGRRDRGDSMSIPLSIDTSTPLASWDYNCFEQVSGPTHRRAARASCCSCCSVMLGRLGGDAGTGDACQQDDGYAEPL